MYIYKRLNPKQRLFRRTALKGGFTLIELLVVVLIIGILAAVALPRYQTAVDKARFVQLQALATPIKNAQELFYLANGEYATKFNQLDVDMPSGGTSGDDHGTERVDYPDGMYCRLFGEVVYCCHELGVGYYSVGLDHSGSAGKHWCVVSRDSRYADRTRTLCRSMGATLNTPGAWEFWSLP